MVYNVLCGNVDDHSKNFSFMMDRQGVWSLAPAYDVLFTVDLDGPKYLNRHPLSLGGRTDGITEIDLLRFAEENDISQAEGVVREVSHAISNWKTFAAETSA